MRRPLQSTFTILLVCACMLAWGQSPQTVNNGQQTQAANFPPGCVYNWTNDKPGIGLPSSGTGDIAAFTAVNNGNTPIVANIKATPVPLGYAYIPNQTSNNISVISIATHAVVKTIDLPGQLNPFGAAATPDGSKMYITNVGSGTVSVINTGSNTVIKTITVGAGPFGIVASPDGSKVYVMNGNSSTISVINTVTDVVDVTITGLSTPQGVCISPDGKWLYVTDPHDPASLYIVNTGTNNVDFTVPLTGVGNNGIAISPDGTTLYIANNNSSTVTVFNTITRAETKVIHGFGSPYGVAVSQDGTRVYVANSSTQKVSVIDAATNAVIKNINTSGVPFGVSLSTDGKELYVANHFSNKVDIFSTADNTLITSVLAGSDPLALGMFTTSIGCNGPPITFSITVNPPAPTIIAGPVTGSISACVGTPSASPNIQQFTVSGSDLTAGIKATAPVGFQVSLSANSGYGSSVLLTQSGGKVTNVVVYVRSAASATGSISGNVVLTSAGAASQNVAVNGVVNELLTVNPVTDKTYNNGDVTSLIAFTGTASTFTWTNDKPGIGLPASGTGDITSFTAVNTGTTPVVATIKVTPMPTSYAYIGSPGSGTVAVINCTTHKVIKSIGVGSIPWGVAVSADGKRVYFVNSDSSTLSVINTADNTVLTTIPVGNDPWGVAVSPDGSRVYVANSNATFMSVIETQTNSVLTTIPNMPDLVSVCVSPDGKWVYAATQASPNKVYIINTATNVVDSFIPLGTGYNYNMVITPDGKSLYFTNNGNSAVTRVNLATKAVSSIPVADGPFGIAINSTGTRVYAACNQAHEIDVINTATNIVIKTIAVAGTPNTVSVSTDDQELYVSCRTPDAVDIYNTANYSKITTVTDLAINSPMSLGNFISNGPGCPGQPITFKITVNSKTAQITATAATGTISACEGSPSASPNIQQFTLSGTSLTAGVTVQAPAKFEVSLNPATGYAASLSLSPAAGNLSNTIIYVRSSQTASGVISGDVIITSSGAAQATVSVSGKVNALPTVNAVANQTVNAGDLTLPVNFTGNANTFTWTNDTPSIGLAATGTGDISAFKALNATTSPVIATVTVTPALHSFAYIPNTDTNDLSVISTITKTVVATIPVGRWPQAVAITPDGTRVFVINWLDNTVSVINASKNAVIATIAVGRSPEGIVMAPDGKNAYVINSKDNTISIINTVTYAVSSIPTVSVPIGIILSPDGSKLYVSSQGDGKIYVIDVATKNILATINVNSSYAENMAISADGSRLYFTHASDPTVSVIDAATNTVISTVAVGGMPRSLTVSPDGTEVFVTNGTNVVAFSTSTKAILATINAGAGPTGICVDPDGLIYVSNAGSDNVSVINPATNEVIKTIAVGRLPAPVENFISNGTNCIGQPVKFTIKVNAKPPAIAGGPVTGAITACTGIPSASPNIQQFAVSGTDLTAGVTATAPAGFEVSLSAGSGYGNSVILNQAGGLVTNAVVYVRSAASATGNIGGSVVLTSAGAGDQSVAVAGTINALPTVNKPGDATYTNGDVTTAINFTGTGTTFTWTNDKPGIGLPANGNGDILPFTAVNTGAAAIVATIKVTPANATGCPGIPQTFTIKVNASPTITAGLVTGNISACAGSSSASPNIQQFTVLGTGLTAGITATAPTGFEVSLSANGGFSNAVTLNQSGGKVTNVLVYVRSATSVAVGPISGKITLASTGAGNLTVGVSGVVNVLPVVNSITDQTKVNGEATDAVNFTGTGNTYTWTNDNPSIGLPASGDGDIASFIAVNMGNTAQKATITITPGNQGLAFIANAKANSVSVINTFTNKVIDVKQVGAKPIGVAVRPDGTKAYVSNIDAGTVSVIDMANNTVSTINVGNNPDGIAISPDGTRVYVANTLSNNVSVINTSNNQVIASIPVGNYPGGVAISPDGARLYVTNDFSTSLSVVNTQTNQEITQIPVGKNPAGVSVSPDGSRIYVANVTDASISVIDAATNMVLSTMTLDSQPLYTAVSRDGGRLYVTNNPFINSAIYVIDTQNNTVIKKIAIGSALEGLAISHDGNYVYVDNFDANAVKVISTASNTLVATIPVGTGPASVGNFISNGTGCTGTPITFTITVTAQAPIITHSPVTGTITACAGSPSTSPNIEQFAVSGTGLTGDITAAAPANFEVSLSPGSGYTQSIVIKQSAGLVSSATVYVRSAASAAMGPISGKIALTSAAVPDVTVDVSGTINAAPVMSAVGNRTYTNGQNTTTIDFTGGGSSYRWVNDNPGIGLPAQGTGSINPFTAVNNGYTPVVANITVTPLAGTYAYIANPQSNNISVVDLTSNSVIKIIPAGINPDGVAVSPGNHSVYITNAGDNYVTVINTITNQPENPIGVGSDPYGLKLNRDETRLYVANLQSNAVSVINTSNNTVIHTIPGFDGPVDVVLNREGTLLFVSNLHSNYVSVVNTNDYSLVTKITVGQSPFNMLLSPDGSRIYVANNAGASISVISTATNTVAATITGNITPFCVALNPDGSKLYVPNVSLSSISVFNTTDYSLITTVNGFGAPAAVEFSADGRYYYVNDEGSNSLVVLNAATNNILQVIPVGKAPSSMGGNFLSYGSQCDGVPQKFTITVNAQPAIITGAVNGTITACAGSPSASPNIQQFTVSGTGLQGDIIATAPIGFEISLTAGDGYAKILTLTRNNGSVTTTIYVRSADYAIGSISGDVGLATPGISSQTVPVSGFINTLPNANIIPNQTKFAGESTGVVNFKGTGDSYRWTNDKPEIGLPASGSGDIEPFVAVNNGSSPIMATITVIPSSSSTGCDGKPVTFTITVNASVPAVISSTAPPNSVSTTYGTPSAPATFTVSGSNMREGIKITPPDGLEVSTDGVTFSNTVTVGSTGTIGPATVYMRLKATTDANTYSGNITLTSAGATEEDVATNNNIVKPYPLTIQASGAGKYYGMTLTDDVRDASYIVAEGILQNGNTITWVHMDYGAGAPAAAQAGLYPKAEMPTSADGANGFKSDNYSIKFVPGDVLVTKAPLTIAADDKIKTYKDPNPALTLTYNGFVNNESPAQLTSLPIASTAADEASVPGKYPILVSGATSPNYDIALVNGVLTVLGINVPLKIPNAFTPNGDGVNDTWNIANIDSYPNCTVNIYNRWGQNVFSSVGYGKSWDGRYKGTLLPVSTYYYIIDLKNDSKPYSGSITIIR